MQYRRILTTALVLFSFNLPIAAGAAEGDEQSPSWGETTGTSGQASVGDQKVDLPGSGRLPADDRTARVAEVEFGGFGTSFGCDGLGLTSMISRFENELEMLVDYYSENAGDLIIQALIYTEPSLYTMLNTTIADLKASMDQMLLGCSEARQWGSRLGSSAKDECLENGGTAAQCNDGEELDEAAAEGLKKKAKKLNEYFDEMFATNLEGGETGGAGGNGGDAGSGAGGGGGANGSSSAGDGGGNDDGRGHCSSDETCGGQFNRLVVNNYINMRDETIDMMRTTIPSLAAADDEQVEDNAEADATGGDEEESDTGNKITYKEKRPGKLQKWLNDKKEALVGRLDTMVVKAGRGDSYAEELDSYRKEPYALAPDGRTLRSLARLREQVLERSGTSPDPDANRFDGTHYARALNLIAAEQARDAAAVAITEIEAGLANAQIDRTTSAVMDDSTVKHYEDAVRTLRAELRMAEQFAESERGQRATFKEIAKSVGAVN